MVRTEKPDQLQSHPPALTIHGGYLWGREHLAASGSAEAAIEAEVLLRHVLGLDRAGLYVRWMHTLSLEAWGRYRRLLEERATGRPVHYIIGQREFMGLLFSVDERVMIPRPETEGLVECVIRAARTAIGPLPREGNRRAAPRSGIVVVDVGTGSGCIAVSVAHFLPEAAVFAIDISKDALTVARSNAIRHGVEGQIQWRHGDLLNPLPENVLGHVDVVVSNPPYVSRGQREGLPREIRDFEPSGAVFVDGDGTAVHRRLIAEAPTWLAAGGLLVMEVGFGQADAVADAVRQDRRYATVSVVPDYAGVPRVVAATRAG
ncbi:MAG TPA: peptide chain release factor N(5)-glutamine methyltransferase [bacterium]|nr:peptide chain release factor N(5)-glutamine methyltransferase [bacterium]